MCKERRGRCRWDLSHLKLRGDISRKTEQKVALKALLEGKRVAVPLPLVGLGKSLILPDGSA